MSSILLNSQVMVYLIAEAVLWFMLGIAFVVTIHILMRWDFGSSSEEQYALERRSFLVMSITLFVFAVKFLLLPYFIFTIDKLSVLVPGAMCAAGVISANGYGMNLLFLKLSIIFLLIFWMTLNHYDLEAKNYPLFRQKNWIFIFIFIAASLELWLDAAYFTHIDIHRPVSCCSALFGQMEGANPLPFGLNTGTMLLLFYLLFVMIPTMTVSGQNFMLLIVLLLFVFVAYYSVVYFFGTYIYELPTHKCPFCMLQKEYYYVGYLVWGSLFGGVFLLLTAACMDLFFGIYARRIKIYGLFLTVLFVLVCSSYVGIYYLRNGVML